MKKSLQILALVFATSAFSQISFNPQLNYNYGQDYSATINANGTIYYTLDGSEPSLSSASANNIVNINVTQNIVVKAKIQNGTAGLSETFSKKFWHTLTSKTVYFKPPTSWSGAPCSYMNTVDPQTTIDFFAPGQKMTAACEGWYKTNYNFAKIQMSFNNCNFISGSPNANYLEYETVSEDTVYYDSSSGPISNPPECLLATQESSKIANVKIAQNPVKDVLIVNSDLKFDTYEIIDYSGKIVRQGNFVKDINVANLQKGSYLVKLLGNNSVQHYLKFIKN
ncbi:chitobiase/beta-hexosaminidase C-terminal domain-containing protein [Soonwooa sp.]|uniref:chitobiase/beta-hexosaminidase C-terminal domain-containing protein n=1 Tax=Soonwooa sp. TaxID=1938592 RepID=UPI0026242294|nr:chitobiase/beta-hexosaminidase C-terminal domain-containing protein [Soonwooa sp.]